MTQLIKIHPQNPQQRLIDQIIDDFSKEGGVLVYPTDSGYAIGCRIGDKAGQEKIRQIRNLDANHHFTLVCRDFSELSHYAQVNNSVFRLLKANTPGAYTFILPATKEVPKRLQHPKRSTIGLRIPDNAITQALLARLDEPLMSVSISNSEETPPLADAEEIKQQFIGRIQYVVDGGVVNVAPTTVVDLTSGVPEVLRHGQGDSAPFTE